MQKRWYVEFGELKEWDQVSILTWLNDSLLARWEHDWPLHRAARKSRTNALESGYRDHADRHIASFTSNTELWQARFSPTETHRRALMLISMLESYMSKLFAFENEPDRTEVMETLADVFRDLLRAQH